MTTINVKTEELKTIKAK